MDVEQFCLSLKVQMFLKHPHVAQIYACFCDGVHFYIVMELCVDGTLAGFRRVIRTDGDRNRVLLGVAKGLEPMHIENLRHGDLKLENVLISFVIYQ